MTTLKTVAAFDSQAEIERTIDTLVEAGIDPADIEVAAPEVVLASNDTALAGEFAVPREGESVLLAVTAPQEDTELVEDILRERGEIDLAASDTPAVGWAGDPEGRLLDKSRTPAIGWAGKASRSG